MQSNTLSPEVLAKLEQSYEDAPSVSRPPDGNYTVEITSVAGPVPSAQKGTPVLVFKLRIVDSEDGKYINMPLTQQFALSSENLLTAAKQMLRRLGYTGPLTQVSRYADQFVGLKVTMQAVTNDAKSRYPDFQNYRLGKVVGTDDEAIEVFE